MNACMVDGCHARHKAKGLCHRHYKQTPRQRTLARARNNRTRDPAKEKRTRFAHLGMEFVLRYVYTTPDGGTEWMEKAACKGEDSTLFFPGTGQSTTRADAICAGCSVKDECLSYALECPELVGTWGGTNHIERARMRKEREGVAA